MSHMVIYRGIDGRPGYQQADDIHDAVGFVETLRNESGVEQARIFRLEEVVFEYRPYYRVELGATAPTPVPSTVTGEESSKRGKTSDVTLGEASSSQKLVEIETTTEKTFASEVKADIKAEQAAETLNVDSTETVDDSVAELAKSSIVGKNGEQTDTLEKVDSDDGDTVESVSSSIGDASEMVGSNGSRRGLFGR